MTQFLVAIFVVLFQVSTLLAQDASGKSTPPPMRATETLPAGPDGAQSASSGATQTPAATPKVSTGAPPQTTQKDAPQAGPAHAPTPPDYSQEAYVVEHYSESMRFENDGTGVIQTDAQIKIVSESGVQALGQLKVGYSALSDKLEIPYVRVH